MSDPATGQPGLNASGSSTETRRAAGVLAGLLLAGLALRLIIAYLLPGSGFAVDLNAFAYWAANLAQDGPWGFYDRPFFHDYTPGYLYVLWALGYVGELLGGLGDLVKVPAIIADLVLAWLVHSMVRELGGSERRALLGAAFVLFVPITWFDSVVWGQVDSVGVVFMLLSLRAVWRDRPEEAALWGTIAAVVKPQLGIIVPIVAAVVIRRALLGRPVDEHGLDPAPTPFVPGAPGTTPEAAEAAGLLGRVRAWSRRERGPIRILTTTAVGIGTAALLSAPFGLSIVGLVEQVVKTAGGYPYLTVNAYNPWALVTDEHGRSLAATGTWLCDALAPEGGQCVGAVSIGPVWAVVAGALLILSVITVVVVVVARHPDRRTILVGLAVLAIAFFVVPTRVHERYLYPFVIVGAILAALSVRWRVAWLVLVVANFLNLYVVLTTIYPDNPSIDDWLGIGPVIRSPEGIAIIALAHLVGFAWALWQLRGRGRTTLAVEVAEARGRPAAIVGEPASVPALAPPGAAATPNAGPGGLPGSATPATPVGADTATLAAKHRAVAAATMAIAHPRPPSSWPERTATTATTATTAPAASAATTATTATTAPRRLGGLRRRLDVRSVRPDRSAGLAGERGGRFGRLDLWLLLVVILVALSFRLFRLEEPRTMHFDEVYHARTATEFLQAWRYGEPHDIYEYTHPHLAKYAMAAGIVAFGTSEVAAESELGVAVRDTALERRWDDPTMPGGRAGDRVYIATGDDVRAYDLASRTLVATIAAPGAVAVSVTADDHRLFIGTSDGVVLVVDTALVLDPLRASGETGATVEAQPFAAVGWEIRRILAAEAGGSVVVSTTDGELVSLEGASGLELGRVRIAGIADLAEAGSGDALVARPGDIEDPDAVAATLDELLGGGVGQYRDLLTADAPVVVVPGALGPDTRGDIETALSEGRLPGLGVEPRARVAVAGTNGLTLVATADASIVDTLDLEEPATAIARVTGVDEDKLYVGNGATITIVLIGGTAAADPRIDKSFWMPSPSSRIAYDSAAQMVYALGERQDGSGPTVYSIEPHANAVFADVPLPFDVAGWAVDEAPRHPSADRQQLLSFSADGASASVDIGRHAFAWRLPGVIAGVLAAAVLFLLARVLWRRRAVAVLVAAFVVLDPMFFVQSRIAMNDVYAGLFIVSAVALFGAVWTGAWRWRGVFWVVMPLVGVLLGLAFATKWVGLYAIGAIAVLVLVRSALGRLLLIAGLLLATTVLGYIAISVPAGATAGGNLTFLVIMIGLTMLAVVVSVLHPVAWSDDEVRFAVGAPAVLGILVFLGSIALGPGASELAAGPLVVPAQGAAFALVALAVVVWAAFYVAGRFGFGPMAPPPAPDDPVRFLPPAADPPPSWLRPGAQLGLPVAWLVVCLAVIPVVVYVASYIPWALIDGHQLFPGWPAGHEGQTLADLTRSMYDYHDKLRATHAASSPWWAWPFDLKPVWFYQGSFAGDTAAAIYDHGSLVTWWLAIPAMGFAAFQAFRRRSLPLALVAIVFACLWLPWARIDRATFQYHWYTSLPFTLLALAYFIAEIWNGPSRRTWRLARFAAALAVMGSPLLWILKGPLCLVAGVEQVNPGSAACVGNPGQLVVTTQVAGIAIVTIVAAALLIWQLVHLERPTADGRVDVGRSLGRLGLTAGGAFVALLIVRSVLDETVILSLPGLQAELVALALAVPLGAVAWVVATARDPRRFAVGFVLAAAAWTIVIYPNISALPLVSSLVNAYQGILPTYLYPFQFAVNTDPAGAAPALLAPLPTILLGALALTAAVVAYSAWVWRLALAERDAHGTGGAEGPSGAEGASAT